MDGSLLRQEDGSVLEAGDTPNDPGTENERFVALISISGASNYATGDELER